MTPVERFLAKLKGVKERGESWAARCPAHGDRTPSLSVSRGANGGVVAKCHAGCSIEAVVAAMELTLRDLMPVDGDSPPTRPNRGVSGGYFRTADEVRIELERQHGRPTSEWTYHDARGEPVGLVFRWDRPGGKTIRPAARIADGWRIGAMPEPRPLYSLPAVADARRVVVFEGEKAAEAARSLGFTATTSAGGSGAAALTDWRPLAGKEVTILPDNDDPGRKYAAAVAAALARLTPAPVVKCVELRGISEGGDIVDWIAAHDRTTDLESLRAEIDAFIAAAQPDLPAGESYGFHPFPIDALPEPIRGFVANGAAAVGCDPSYLALPLLVVLAAAVGTTRRLQLKHEWSAPSILWGAIVGDSGTAKTTAFKLAVQAVRDRQRKALARHAEAMRRFETESARWEKEYAVWKRSKRAAGDPPQKPNPPACERCVVGDTTVEALAPILLTNPRGVLLARDELAGWLGSFDRYAGKGRASADAANWLSMFNAEAVVTDRKTGTMGTIHVPEAAVSVVGGIQPGILRRALGTEHRESGLAARLLLAYPPRRAKQWTEADLEPGAKAEIARLVDGLHDLQPTTTPDGELQAVMVRLSAEAKAVWIEYYNAHAAEQSDLTGDLAAAWSKLEEYAARLALVIYLTRRAANDPTLPGADTLDAESMAAGVRLAAWFKGEARRVYAMLGESTADGDRRRLIEWVARKGGSASVREVQQGCRWLKATGAAEAALQELVTAGHGYWQDVSGTPKGGRPTRRFSLNSPAAAAVPIRTTDGVS